MYKKLIIRLALALVMQMFFPDVVNGGRNRRYRCVAYVMRTYMSGLSLSNVYYFENATEGRHKRIIERATFYCFSQDNVFTFYILVQSQGIN